MTDLAKRYGTSSRVLRPLLITGVTVLAAAALGWLVWVMAVHTAPAVRSQLVSYDVRGQHAALARFQVVRSGRHVGASCLLRATATDHSVVGELNVPVGVDQPTEVVLDRAVRTERRATAVELVGCTADGQNQPR